MCVLQVDSLSYPPPSQLTISGIHFESCANAIRLKGLSQELILRACTFIDVANPVVVSEGGSGDGGGGGGANAVHIATDHSQQPDWTEQQQQQRQNAHGEKAPYELDECFVEISSFIERYSSTSSSFFFLQLGGGTFFPCVCACVCPCL